MKKLLSIASLFVVLSLTAACNPLTKDISEVSATCSAPQWRGGNNYTTGNKVMFNGKTYVATHDNPGYDPAISSWYWSTSACDGGSAQTEAVAQVAAGSGSGFRSFFTRDMFRSMFPNRLPIYTYDGLSAAIDEYPGFAKQGDTDTRKREVAAFLANVAHESGHLQYVREANKANWNSYCDRGNKVSPCAAGRLYYGRGPLQLSWNYNYGAAAKAIGAPILANPDLVATDAKITWKTAIWFWMTQTGASNMTAHNAMINGAGFGQTIRTINGSVECGGKNPAQVQSRISNYKNYTNLFKVSINASKLGC